MSATVVVAGGAGDIGSNIAESFRADGLDVLILDASPRTADIAKAIGADYRICDVSDSDSLDAAVAGIDSVSALVNAVGAWPLQSLDELTPEIWNKTIAINLTGTFMTTRALLAPLRAAKGSVINFSSSVALRGFSNMIAYSAAKAGVLGLTRSLSTALGVDGVRVNAVIPGVMATASNHMLDDSVFADARTERALHRDGLPGDLVGIVRFLAGDTSSFITGQSFVVDGGHLFQ
jgi:3-oxoacyl-[acyl-carrier protein] reductase